MVVHTVVHSSFIVRFLYIILLIFSYIFTYYTLLHIIIYIINHTIFIYYFIFYCILYLTFVGRFPSFRLFCFLIFLVYSISIAIHTCVSYFSFLNAYWAQCHGLSRIIISLVISTYMYLYAFYLFSSQLFIRFLCNSFTWSKSCPRK